MPATALARPPVRNRQQADRVLAQCLRTARARLAGQRFVERAAAGLLLVGGLLVAVSAAQVFWRAENFPLHADWRLAVVLAAAALFGAAASAFVQRPGLAATARELDRRANTRDRLVTALTLGERAAGEPLAPVERLAWDECTRFAQNFSVRRWTPFSLPRAVRFLPVPLVTLAFLLAYQRLPGLRPADAGADPALQQILTAQADELKRAADAARRADDPAAKALAQELDRAARRLQESAGRRDALRELSALEARLRQMQSERPSPAELSALAAALEREGSEAARAAAEALRKGDAEEAARQLEKLLEQLKKGRGESAAEALAQLARSMKEQAEKLTPEQRGAVSRQMQQAAADAAEAQKNAGLLQKISELLRQAGAQAASGNRGGGSSGQSAGAPGAGQGGGGGRQLTTQQLESLLRALEDMKSGLNGNGQGQGNGLRLALEGFGKPPGQDGGNGGVQQSGPGPTGGAPGSEHDVGTSELGKEPVANNPAPDRAARVQGQLGEGESLQNFAPTTLEGANARSRREFRDGIERAQAQAQETVQQENIPLGSRFLVERYFKNIRPPE